MEKNPFKKVKIQSLIITCYLLGTAFSASLFGLDFSAPRKVIRTGVDEISQVFRPNNRQQTGSPISQNNQFSDKDDSFSGRNRNSFRALVPAEIADMFKPQEPPKPINKPLERNQTTPIPVKDGGSTSCDKNPPNNKNAASDKNALNNKNAPNNNIASSDNIVFKDNPSAPLDPVETTTDVYDLTDNFFTLGWSDNGTEFYTTETSEYETTTNEPLNRIGGVPPGVLASILGAG